MHKEIQIPRTELEPLAENLASVFFQRRDIYARQMDNGRYISIHKPLESWQLVSHLKGKLTLGTYVLDAESQARFIAFDADDNQQLVGLTYMAQRLMEDDVPTYLESSRRGGHLWLFFEQPILGREARAFGKGLLAAHDLKGIELFPKQDQLGNGPGSLIRLPFGIHRRDGRRYGFINLEGQPLAPTLADQIQLLSAPQTVPEIAFDTYLELGYQSKQKADIQPSEASGTTLSSRIKDSITVLDFVSQYVERSPNGRGLCPFHNDKRASFSVNEEEN
ncbi:MAG: hypothetical protein KAI94_01380, partial [Anaerolineales bacterium]|nr:hypothetical protein [Anaerolineales bacterium]